MTEGWTRGPGRGLAPADSATALVVSLPLWFVHYALAALQVLRGEVTPALALAQSRSS